MASNIIIENYGRIRIYNSSKEYEILHKRSVISCAIVCLQDKRCYGFDFKRQNATSLCLKYNSSVLVWTESSGGGANTLMAKVVSNIMIVTLV